MKKNKEIPMWCYMNPCAANYRMNYPERIGHKIRCLIDDWKVKKQNKKWMKDGMQ